MALIDRLKFDGPRDVLVWKHPSDALTLGAQVIVNEAQEAVFYKGGQALDLFGPGTHTLSTANLPILSKLINLPFGGKTPFTAEVYYVNKALALAHEWGTAAPVMVLDARYRVSVPLRAFGQFAVRVSNSREFLVKIVGAGRPGEMVGSQVAVDALKSPVLSTLQEALGKFVAERGVSVFELPAQTYAIAQAVRGMLAERYETCGIELVNFTIESVNFNAKDPSVEQLRKAMDEAARLDVVGASFGRNREFYQADKQFDVLKTAAGNEGGAGTVMGAAMGVGMGFGVAGPAADVARQSMRPEGPRCGTCNAVVPGGGRFCPACGGQVAQAPQTARCPRCSADNVVGAKFCSSCGQSMAGRHCTGCGAKLADGTRFCAECGVKAEP